ncbi:hypothetical protein DL764_004497 [Monosporascus ibericus]|uniref:Cyanovirin-N domain-containing protein n=1 Tax=Monosporascus ibericus TaxID=155417 RepID=A0A4Q4TCC5_9PEZI|nr:hypothetical protein DL764_004497 [Monosporascus ibericus]
MQSVPSFINLAVTFLAIFATTSFGTVIAGAIGLLRDGSDVEVAVDTISKWEGYSYTCTKSSIEVREEGGKWYMKAQCPKMDGKTFLKSELDLDNCYKNKDGMLFEYNRGNFSESCHSCALSSSASGFPNEFTCVCDPLEQTADPVHLHANIGNNDGFLQCYKNKASLVA